MGVFLTMFFDRDMSLNLKLSDLARMARLAMVIYLPLSTRHEGSRSVHAFLCVCWGPKHRSAYLTASMLHTLSYLPGPSELC